MGGLSERELLTGDPAILDRFCGAAAVVAKLRLINPDSPPLAPRADTRIVPDVMERSAKPGHFESTIKGFV
jgi:hypothetical protein